MLRFPRAGAVDADGHVAEPADVWEKNLENKYKPRALRILTDSDGLEYLESDGKPVPFVAKGIISRVHAMGSDPVANESDNKQRSRNCALLMARVQEGDREACRTLLCATYPLSRSVALDSGRCMLLANDGAATDITPGLLRAEGLAEATSGT